MSVSGKGSLRGAGPSRMAEPTPAFPFIVGRGRSGTTLVRAILDSHPVMAIPGESHFIVTMAGRRRKYERSDGFAVAAFVDDLTRYPTLQLWDLSPEEVAGGLAKSSPRNFVEAVRVVFALYARRQGKPRYGEKTPINVVHIPLLADLFTEGRFVHLIRDGRNVALSYFDAGFGPRTIEEAAIYWRRFVRRGRRAGLILGPARYLEVRYEGLLDETERVVRSMAAFLDLEFENQMLRYFERADQVALTAPYPESHRNLYLPPTKGLRDWRRQMSREEAAMFDALAGDLLLELGYEPATDRVLARTRVRALSGRARVEANRVSHGLRKRLQRLGTPRVGDGAASNLTSR